MDETNRLIVAPVADVNLIPTVIKIYFVLDVNRYNITVEFYVI